MCVGVLMGLDIKKFSGSIKKVGRKKTKNINKLIIIIKPIASFEEKNGWKSEKSIKFFKPKGLLDKVSCKKIKWIKVKNNNKKGNKKWKE